MTKLETFFPQFILNSLPQNSWNFKYRTFTIVSRGLFSIEFVEKYFPLYCRWIHSKPFCRHYSLIFGTWIWHGLRQISYQAWDEKRWLWCEVQNPGNVYFGTYVAYLTHGDYISKSRQSAAWMKINFLMWKYASKRNEKRLLENLLFPPFSHGTQKF